MPFIENALFFKCIHLLAATCSRRAKHHFASHIRARCIPILYVYRCGSAAARSQSHTFGVYSVLCDAFYMASTHEQALGETHHRQKHHHSSVPQYRSAFTSHEMSVLALVLDHKYNMCTIFSCFNASYSELRHFASTNMWICLYGRSFGSFGM